MLSLRLLIVMSLSGVALWGLFSLLENLREPELLRSAKAVVVKGCDPIESGEAARLCPQLFCQKYLLDARAFPLRSRFETTVDQKAEGQQLIGGVARQDGARDTGHFACVLENNKVTSARVIPEPELDALATRSSDWLPETAQ